MTDEQTMACKLTDDDLQELDCLAYDEGAEWAYWVFAVKGSLGATREAAIAAFTRGYDEKAAELLEGK
jgi:hypothetical protein